MSVQQNLEFFGRFKGVDQLEMQISHLLDQCSMTEQADKKAKVLSGG
jgi:ABC-type multidrug transport system ATPase subunit